MLAALCATLLAAALAPPAAAGPEPAAHGTALAGAHLAALEAHLAALADALDSDDLDTWRRAALALENEGPAVVPLVVSRVRAGELDPLRAERVLGHLARADARKAALLALPSGDEAADVALASALADLGAREAATRTGAALAAARLDTSRLLLARALWKLQPDDASARAILDAARRPPALLQTALRDPFLETLLAAPARRRLLSADERLEWLLDFRLPRALSGAGLLQARASGAGLADADDLAFVRQQSAAAAPRLLAALGDPARAPGAPALLLAFLAEPRALPLARARFLSSAELPDWRDQELSVRDEDFPEHRALAEAIAALAGTSTLAAAIAPTDGELAALVADARGADANALYVLARLRPALALGALGDLLRSDVRGPRERTTLCRALADALPEGMAEGELPALLGPPFAARRGRLVYDCSGPDGAFALVLRLRKGALLHAQLARGAPE